MTNRQSSAGAEEEEGLRQSGISAVHRRVAGTAALSVFAAEFLAAVLVVFTYFVIAAIDFKRSAANEKRCQFFPRIGIDPLYCRAGYVHLFSALFLGQSDIVDQADRFIFFECHYLDAFFFFRTVAVKEIILRKAADTFAFFWSCHF